MARILDIMYMLIGVITPVMTETAVAHTLMYQA